MNDRRIREHSERIRSLLHKLSRESPRTLLVKLWWRAETKRRRRRARRHWAHPKTTSPKEIPSDFTSSGALAMWPGARDGIISTPFSTACPQAYAECVHRAQAGAQGRFDLLGSGEVSVLDAAGRFRWHEDFKAGAVFPNGDPFLDIPICLEQKGTDIKVPWELSRFQHVFAFIGAGGDKFNAAFLAQWNDWQEQNPLARGVNWVCPMDVALRAISWTAALACWWDTWNLDTRGRMWASLVDHARFIRDNLEWQPIGRANHYFTDIIGLLVLGVVLRGYEPAADWMDFAASEFQKEVMLQFAADGFNKECSTAYHKLMVELASVGLFASRAGGLEVRSPVIARIRASYEATAVLGGQEGRIPLIGDNDSGRVFPILQRDDTDVRYLYSVGRALFPDISLPQTEPCPEVTLLTGKVPEQIGAPVGQGETKGLIGSELPDSGFFVLGDGGDRLILRCGPTTYSPIGMHLHQDQLSLCLFLGGREFLVDPGQMCYTPWPDRSLWYRGPGAHNTIVMDNALQTRVADPDNRYCYVTTGDPSPRGSLSRDVEGLLSLEASHRGYCRLPGGGIHSRRVTFDGIQKRWRIEDQIEARGSHTYEWFFHLAEHVVPHEESDCWRFSRNGTHVELRWADGADPCGRIEESSCAPGYGREIKAQTIVFKTECDGPMSSVFSLQIT